MGTETKEETRLLTPLGMLAVWLQSVIIDTTFLAAWLLGEFIVNWFHGWIPIGCGMFLCWAVLLMKH